MVTPPHPVYDSMQLVPIARPHLQMNYQSERSFDSASVLRQSLMTVVSVTRASVPAAPIPGRRAQTRKAPATVAHPRSGPATRCPHDLALLG